ncbi:MAG: NAD-dependent isocitrate dehydrogenase, partial [Deltaproteobacteria bacterium]
VLLMGNLYGDILSDIGCALVGGISAAPSISRGDEVAIFEMVHGNAPELVGKNLANPLPMLIPAIYMLRHLGKNEVAERIYRAVCRVLEAGIVTRDLGGSATTTEMTGAIIAALEG